MVTPVTGDTELWSQPPLPAISSLEESVARSPLFPVEEPKPLDPLLSQRDPRFIRRIFPYLAWYTDKYFRAETHDIENLPDGRCMAVATHNGGFNFPDLYCLMVAFWRHYGLETPGYGLMHSAAFKIPFFGSVLTKVGAVEATHENCSLVLRSGFPLLICPGGDVDSLKPFRKRHRITFGARRGFIKMAIREQVPIVPIISVGAHETLFFLNDGAKLARMMGVDRSLRIKSVPFAFSFPFGITLGGLFSIPLPSKIVIQVMPKIELAENPASSDDPEVVERCFEHVRSRMQKALDRLASKRKHVILG